MAFKDNLVKIRRFRKLEPMDVVNGTGIDKQQYYAWEAGKYKAGDDNLDLLSRFFMVPVMLFFKETITDSDMQQLDKSNNDDEWYRKTIDNLIHQNGEAMKLNKDTIKEFAVRDKEEINSLKTDKDKLLDVLVSHFKPSQNRQ